MIKKELGMNPDPNPSAIHLRISVTVRQQLSYF